MSGIIRIFQFLVIAGTAALIIWLVYTGLLIVWASLVRGTRWFVQVWKDVWADTTPARFSDKEIELLIIGLDSIHPMSGQKTKRMIFDLKSKLQNMKGN